MELIKQIKQAEVQAREIIELAKAESAKQIEKGKEDRQAVMTQAEQQRKKATEEAVAAARSEAVAEVENLKAQAQQKRQQLRDTTAGKMAKAAQKVMDYLRG